MQEFRQAPAHAMIDLPYMPAYYYRERDKTFSGRLFRRLPLRSPTITRVASRELRRA